MQLVLHCVAENTHMATKWDGVLFFKKIHPPKKTQQTSKAQTPSQKNQTNKQKPQANH